MTNASAYKILPNVVIFTYDIYATLAPGQNVVGATTSKVTQVTWGSGRITTSGSSQNCATCQALSNGGQFRIMSPAAAVASTGTIMLIVNG